MNAVNMNKTPEYVEDKNFAEIHAVKRPCLDPETPAGDANPNYEYITDDQVKSMFASWKNHDALSHQAVQASDNEEFLSALNRMTNASLVKRMYPWIYKVPILYGRPIEQTNDPSHPQQYFETHLLEICGQYAVQKDTSDDRLEIAASAFYERTNHLVKYGAVDPERKQTKSYIEHALRRSVRNNNRHYESDKLLPFLESVYVKGSNVGSAKQPRKHHAREKSSDDTIAQEKADGQISFEYKILNGLLEGHNPYDLRQESMACFKNLLELIVKSSSNKNGNASKMRELVVAPETGKVHEARVIAVAHRLTAMLRSATNELADLLSLDIEDERSITPAIDRIAYIAFSDAKIFKPDVQRNLRVDAHTARILAAMAVVGHNSTTLGEVDMLIRYPDLNKAQRAAMLDILRAQGDEVLAHKKYRHMTTPSQSQ